MDSFALFSAVQSHELAKLTNIDPATGELTHLSAREPTNGPDHFASRVFESRVGRIQIVRLTPIRSARMRVLDINEELRQVLRYEIFLSTQKHETKYSNAFHDDLWPHVPFAIAAVGEE